MGFTKAAGLLSSIRAPKITSTNLVNRSADVASNEAGKIKSLTGGGLSNLSNKASGNVKPMQSFTE